MIKYLKFIPTTLFLGLGYFVFIYFLFNPDLISYKYGHVVFATWVWIAVVSAVILIQLED